MPAEAWTQADVDALKRAIADGRGARTISFDAQTVTFSSIPEMLNLLTVMQAAVTGAVAEAAGTNARTRYAGYSKGV